MKLSVIGFFWVCALNALGQQVSFKREVDDFQRGLNAEYKDPKKSPLAPGELRKFKGLDFFSPDSIYRVVAKVVMLKNQVPFTILTNTGMEDEYIKFAELLFTLKGKEYKLIAYQAVAWLKTEDYKNYLFVPFRDETNGTFTYAGGRYLDLRIPNGETLVINFNKAYNPLCAYNPRKYSCSFVPQENTLDTEIAAGVRFVEGK